MRRAVSFLTPFGGAAVPDSRTLRWFPPAGLAIGAVVGLVWWAAGKAWHGPLLPAAVAVTADLAVTGMLHLDGLADSADGLLAHLPRERRLAVMAEPGIGAFGAGVVAAALLVRFASFSTLRPHVATVAGLWCASRSLMALGPVWLPYAREQGLATAFLGDRSLPTVAPAAGGLVVAALCAAWGAGWGGVAGVVAGVAGGAAVLALGRARIGGFTGDVLGAAGVITETLGLAVMAARW